MSVIERCELAPGFSVARVLTGLWQIADMERDGMPLEPVATARAMAPYVEAGFTTFDMADHYGSAEVIAGAYRTRVASDGDAVQMLTKWVPKPGPVTRTAVRDAIHRSLDRLRMDRLDLLQFHTWNYHDLSYLDCLGHLQELQGEGIIGHLGLTNFDTAHLRVVVESGIDIVSNQVSYSLVDQRAAGAMTDYCQARGVKILAYGTLAGGFLSDRWLDIPEPQGAELGTWSQKKYKRFLDAAGGWGVFQRVLRTLRSVAESRQVSIANLAARTILEQPAVGGIIVGARIGESEHIEETRKLFQFTLDEETLGVISEAIAQFQPIRGDCGDEYRVSPFLTASGDLTHHVENFPPASMEIHVSEHRSRVSSGSEWEELAGYSRAVRDGRRILVSGTTASHGARRIGGDDPTAQTHFILDKIRAAVESLGGSWEDIVRTRIYVKTVDDWEPVARVHGERFRDVCPANTLVQANLVGVGYRVEIEAEALVPSSPIRLNPHGMSIMNDTHEFELYDLRVEVVDGPSPMVCNHEPGDFFTLRGENLEFPPGQTFPLYPLAALLPLLPAKQRHTHANDWMSTDMEVACPDPHCGARFRITRIGTSTFRHGEVTRVPWKPQSDEA